MSGIWFAPEFWFVLIFTENDCYLVLNNCSASWIKFSSLPWFNVAAETVYIIHWHNTCLLEKTLTT